MENYKLKYERLEDRMKKFFDYLSKAKKSKNAKDWQIVNGYERSIKEIIYPPPTSQTEIEWLAQ